VHRAALARRLEQQSADHRQQVAIVCERVWARPLTDHERLSVRHDGTDRRLTDVHGRVFDVILA